MSQAMRAVVREGRIELLDKIKIPEGTELIVTPFHEDDDFWLKASESSLGAIWDNSEDDVYEQCS